MIGTEILPQGLEEGDAGSGRQLYVAIEDFSRERHPGGLSALGEELAAELDQIGRAPFRYAPAIARPVNQSPAALGDRLQQLTEEGGVHGTEFLARLAHEIGIW